MTLKELLEKWNKVSEALQKEQHMPPEQIPTVSNILDAAKDNGFFMNLESILESFMRKHPETRNHMVQAGLLEADDEKSWDKLNTDWMLYAEALYKADINRRQRLKAEQWARDNIKSFDEETIQTKLQLHSNSPLYAHAIRKINAEQEYYPGYDKLTDDQKKKINSNKIPELIDTYYAEAGNPKLQDFINKRIERLMNMKKAFAKASKIALGGDQQPHYGKLRHDDLGTRRMWFPIMQYEHPGLQSTTQGCWSVTLSALLKHKGIDVSQNDLRQFKPADDLDFSNRDCGQELSNYAPLIHELLPNTMVCKSQQEVTVGVNEKDPKKLKQARSEARNALSNLLECGLAESKSPIGLLINGHYRVVYGVEYGYGAETVWLHDPYSDRTTQTTLDKLVEESLNNGKYTFNVDWIQDFKVNDKKTPIDLPRNMEAEVTKSPNQRFYTFKSSSNFDITADMPTEIYTEDELKKHREEAARKLDEFNALDEKLKRWDENTKSSLSAYENERKLDPLVSSDVDEADDLDGIDEIKKQIDKITTSIEKNDKLLKDIEKALKDIPSDEDLEQAKEILPPKKTDELQSQKPEIVKKLTDIRNKLEKSQKRLNTRVKDKAEKYQELVLEEQKKEEERLKRLEDNKNARQEIFDSYMAIKDTRDYGRKSHEPFHQMINALRYYKATQMEDAMNVFTDKQKQQAAKDLHDACAAYLEKHIIRDKSGSTKIGGQTYETGAMRKQAAVQVMELLETLPEYQQAIKKEQNDLVIQEEIAPVKKGNEVKREKMNFNQLKGDLKASLSKHTKAKPVAPDKDAAYADLEAAKARIRADRF